MAFVSKTIPNLINGVSQQAPTQRLPSQGAAQINCRSSLVNGLERRPPSQHVARLTTTEDWARAFVHTINRDRSERYVAVISEGTLKVFDLDGVAQTVSFPNGSAYLTSAAPDDDFRAVTVADYTFIVNKAQVAALAADTTPARDFEALVNVRQGQYGSVYKIIIDGTERASFSAPNGSSSSHSTQITTQYIADQLKADLDAASASLPTFTVTQYQNAIHISSTVDFTIAVEDGSNGNAVTVAKDRIQNFSDLPTHGPDGFVVEIAGDQTNSFDNYYVRFEKQNDADSSGVWIETVAGGLQFKLDAATMPHALVRNSDGTFTFDRATWGDREVGDDDSAPAPSFVGRQINDVFFFRNRLGFLSDESVSLSRASDFFNYWPKTVTAVVDSDPIDVSATTNQVSILRYAVPFDQSLFIFSDQAQLSLEGGDLLTPKTASIQLRTDFVADDVAPVKAGRFIYFASPSGSYNSIREYFTDQVADIEDAPEVTRHVPRFIPAGAHKMSAAPNEDMVAVLTTGDANRVYIYSYYWQAQNKLQSSWSFWEFGAADVVLSCEFVDTNLMLVVLRADGTYLERVDIDEGAVDPGSLDLLTRLDRRVTEADCTVSYDSNTDTTTVTLPYSESGDVLAVVRAGNTAQGLPEGYVATATRPSATTLAIPGDWSAVLFHAGLRYQSLYTFSPFFLRDSQAADGRSQVAVNTGRLGIRRLTVVHRRTSQYDVVVTPLGRGPFTYKFTGKTIGGGVLGALNLEDGVFQVPVRARNTDVTITIQTDGPYPWEIPSAEWEGDFTILSRRV